MEVGADLYRRVVARQRRKQIGYLVCVGLSNRIGQRHDGSAHGCEYAGKLQDDIAVIRIAVRIAKAHADIHDQVFSGSRHHLADLDRKSTRLNSSHVKISYAVFCLKKKTNKAMTFA